MYIGYIYNFKQGNNLKKIKPAFLLCKTSWKLLRLARRFLLYYYYRRISWSVQRLLPSRGMSNESLRCLGIVPFIRLYYVFFSLFIVIIFVYFIVKMQVFLYGMGAIVLNLQTGSYSNGTHVCTKFLKTGSPEAFLMSSCAHNFTDSGFNKYLQDVTGFVFFN